MKTAACATANNGLLLHKTWFKINWQTIIAPFPLHLDKHLVHNKRTKGTVQNGQWAPQDVSSLLLLWQSWCWALIPVLIEWIITWVQQLKMSSWISLIDKNKPERGRHTQSLSVLMCHSCVGRYGMCMSNKEMEEEEGELPSSQIFAGLSFLKVWQTSVVAVFVFDV